MQAEGYMTRLQDVTVARGYRSGVSMPDSQWRPILHGLQFDWRLLESCA